MRACTNKLMESSASASVIIRCTHNMYCVFLLEVCSTLERLFSGLKLIPYLVYVDKLISEIQKVTTNSVCKKKKHKSFAT